MNLEQLAAFMRDYGPGLLDLLVLILSPFFGLLGWFVRRAWKRHRLHMQSIGKAISDIQGMISANKEATRSEHAKIWETVQTLRGELHLHKNMQEYLKAGLTASEGAMKHQTSRIDAYIERMGQLDAKIEAIFKWLDRQGSLERRATDT